MANKTETLKFQGEFNFIQILLNIIDVQHFKYGNHKNVQGKPSRLRLILVTLKLLFVAILITVELLDMNQRIVVGSSLTAALVSVTLYFLFIMLMSIIVQSYRASQNIKLIYDDFQIVLLILKCFEIDFDFLRFRKRATVRFVAFIILYLTCFLISDDMQKLLGFFLIFTLYPFLIIVFFVYFYIFQIDLVNLQLNCLIEAIEKNLKVDNFQEKKNELFRNCREVFNAISNSLAILNKSFGLIIMEIIIFTVISITFNGYKIVIAFKDVKESVIFYGKLEFMISCMHAHKQFAIKFKTT